MKSIQRTVIRFAFLTALLAQPAAAQFLSWSSAPALPASRAEGAAAVLNGKLYYVGGYESAQSTPSGALFVLDKPTSASWSQHAASLNVPRFALALVAAEGRLWAIGGAANGFGSQLSDVESIDPENDSTWRTETSLNVARRYPAGAYYLGRIYLAGGAKFGGNGQALANLTSFAPADPRTQTEHAGLPTPRITNLLPLRGRLFTCGGSASGNPLNMVERWFPDLSTSTNSGSWSTATATVPTPFNGSAAGLLGENIYLAGGANTQFLRSDVFRFDAGADGWATATSLPAGRQGFSLVGFGGGLYAIGGLTGVSSPGSPSSAVLRGDLVPAPPSTFHTDQAGALNVPRTRFGALQLKSGAVAVFGGRLAEGAGSALSVVETLATSTSAWKRLTNAMPLGLIDARPVELVDGKVLIAGGRGDGGPTANLFHFRPGPEDFVTSGGSLQLNVTRAQHSVTRLADGRVLIAGGLMAGSPSEVPTGSFEIFTPGAVTSGDQITLGASLMPDARFDHSATLLQDGTVLFAGGTVAGAASRICYLFNPQTRTFHTAGLLAQARSGHAALALPDGSVLVTGGAPTGATGPEAELYDPGFKSWSGIPGGTRRLKTTLSLLPSGDALIAGGETLTGLRFSSVERVTVKDRSASSPGFTLASPRSGHRAVSLDGVETLLIGGGTQSSASAATAATASAERVLSGPQPNRAPVAVIQAPAVALRRQAVQLDGRQSSDPDSDSFTYAWTDISTGNLSGQLTNTSSAVATFTTTVPGTHSFRLVCTDAHGTPGTITANVGILPNQPPIARTGANQFGTSGTFNLDGSTSSDPDQDPFTFQWTQTAGPTVAINGATAAIASVTLGNATAVYTFQLQVTDSLSASSTAKTTVTITLDQPPVPNPGPNQTVRLAQAAPFQQLDLDGRGSSDPDGDTITYLWEQTLGPTLAITNPTGSIARVTPTSAATYVFKLTVDDHRGLTQSREVAVLVNPYNRLPISRPGANTTVEANTVAHLDGGASSDPDGDPFTYKWTQQSGPATAPAVGAATKILTVTPSAPGTYVFDLELADDHGGKSNAQVTLTVLPANRAPSANAGADTTVTIDTLVTLDGGQSVDPDGDAVTFRWTQLAGPTIGSSIGADARRFSFTPSTLGRYVLLLSVTDSRRATGTDAVQVDVISGNRPPIANPGPDKTDAIVNVAVRLDGGASSDPDAGDRVVNYLWTFRSGPATPTLIGAGTSVVQFTPTAVGSYELLLTVKDSRGAISSSRVFVIAGSGNRPPRADAGIDRFVPVNQVVQADGFRSSDPDGDALTYSWKQLSGPTVAINGAQTASISFTPTVTGPHRFQLTVSDGKTGSATATVTLTAATPSQLGTAAAIGTWFQMAEMPTPRRQFASVAVRGKIYTFGGSRGGSLEPLNTVEIYDPLVENGGKWTSGPPMPTPRIGPAATVFGGRIFVIGGRTVAFDKVSGKDKAIDCGTVEIFDIVTQGWSSAPPLARARRELAAATLDGKLYATGGAVSTGATTSTTTAHERFDPLEPQKGWVPDTRLVRGRKPAMAPLSGRLYVVGGETSGVATGAVEIFTPRKPTAANPFVVGGDWNAAVGAARTLPTIGHGAAALGGRIYVAGGRLGQAATSFAERYDPALNAWQAIPPLNFRRYDLCLVNLAGSLYAIGGAFRDRADVERAASIVERFDAGDDHPNSVAGVKANDSLPLDTTVEAAIERGGDVDFFKFTTTAQNERIRIETGPPGSFEDTVLTLFNPAGVPIVTVDDPAKGVRLASATVVCTAPGDYFAAVSFFDARLQGLYAVRATRAVTAVDDAPNFRSPAAPSVAMGSSVTGSLEVPGDVDFFKVTLQSGKDYVFRTALGTVSDTVLGVFSSDLNDPRPLRENDDGSDGTLASRVAFTAPADGTYFLRVLSFDPRASGTYSVSAEVLSDKVFSDDHPNRPTGIRTEDTLTHEGNSLGGAIETTGDVDFFRLVTRPDSAYAFSATPSGSFKVQLTLFDRDGTTILVDAQEGSESADHRAEIRGFRPSYQGTYFLRVQRAPRADGDTSPLTGSYTIASTLEGTETPAKVSLARSVTGGLVVASVILSSLPTDRQSLRNAEFGLVYDASLLEPVSIQAGTATTAGQLLEFASPKGFLGFSVVTQEEELSRTGSLVSVSFRSIGTSPLASYSVILGYVATASGLTRHVDLAPDANPGPGQIVNAQVVNGTLLATIPDPLADRSNNRRAHVRLDGRGSTDPNLPPRALTYAWTVLTSPAPVTLSDPASAIPTFAPSSEGFYEFALVVSNSALSSLPKRTRVIVGRTNHPPTALLQLSDLTRGTRSQPGAAPLTVVAGVDTVRLDGRLSVDADAADRGHLTYSWTQVTGPAVTLSPGATASVVSFVPSTAAVLEFELRVKDSSGAESQPRRARLIVVSPLDTPPQVSVSASASTTLSTGADLGELLEGAAGVSLRVTLPTHITIKAKVSDPDLGSLPLKQQASYVFSQESGPPVQLSTTVINGDISGVGIASFDPTTQGVHVFSVVVSSLTSAGADTGVQVRRQVRILVDGPTRLPVASARIAVRSGKSKRWVQPQGDSQVAAAGDTVQLDGSLSASFEGATLGASWNQVAGPQVVLSDAFSPVTTFVAPDFGDGSTQSYSFQLIVDDAAGQSEPALLSFSVAGATATSSATIPFGGGLSLIGIPVASPTAGGSVTAQELIDDLSASYVMRLVSNGSRNRFEMFAPGYGMTAPTLAGNEGYLISRPASFKSQLFSGRAWPSSARTVSLVPGINLVYFPAGVPSTWTARTLCDLVDQAGGRASFVVRTLPDPLEIQQSSPGTGSFDVYLPGASPTAFALRQGRGYLLRVFKFATIELPASP